MSNPLLLRLNDDSLRKVFFESKRLLKGLQSCKDVRNVLLKGLLFAKLTCPTWSSRMSISSKDKCRGASRFLANGFLGRRVSISWLKPWKLGAAYRIKPFCGYEILGCIPSSPACRDSTLVGAASAKRMRQAWVRPSSSSPACGSST